MSSITASFERCSLSPRSSPEPLAEGSSDGQKTEHISNIAFLFLPGTPNGSNISMTAAKERAHGCMSNAGKSQSIQYKLIVPEKKAALLENPDEKNRKVFRIHSTKKEYYTQKTFSVLINEQAQKKLPYFFAVSKSPNNKKPFITDGLSFITENFNKIIGFEPRSTNFSFRIYKSSKQDRIFNLFCTEKSLLKNHEYCLRKLCACDSEIIPYFRAKERFYLASTYEDKAANNPEKNEKYLTKALQWLRLSIEDESVDGCYMLAKWFILGNGILEQSKANSLSVLSFLAHNIPDSHPQLREALIMYKKIILCESQGYQDELDFLEKRLNKTSPSAG
jgi:hypothetical protein